MEDNEFASTQWEGPGDSLGGLMASSSGGDFTELDSAFAEPEWAKRGEGIHAVQPPVVVQKCEEIKPIEPPTEFIVGTPVEPERRTYNTTESESMKELSLKFYTGNRNIKFNPILDEAPTYVRTHRIPIGDNVFGTFNTFNLTSQIMEDIFAAGKKTELLGITNLRVEGPIMSYVKSVKLVCSMKVIDTIYDFGSWRTFRALYADDQSDPGRMPFSCMLGNAIPQSPSTHWQLLVEFDKPAQTMNRDDAYISFDIVQCSPTEFKSWTRPIVYTELCKPSDILKRLCVGVLVRGAELNEFSHYQDKVVLGQKYALGSWNWYPFGQAMLRDLPFDAVLGKHFMGKVVTNLEENIGVVCVCITNLSFSLEGGLRVNIETTRTPDEL